ncbi:helix-turn-helix domain-containing protein [Streptomyces sp. MA5143a]|uniref:helix-turn-helix domain-containing protein n=1 Tax=Streptomyces sp. MA5143a TaxID=2083010 RepID=UPI000D1A53E2|nr:helix-turn-helix transcriptional regulator [Streptomyces sp. MA5143a]SPF03250.1 hypothetical protein SMA5143A_4019 [Streptomyces sp. MA5143a]
MSELIAGEMRRLKKQSGLSFAKLAARTHYSRSSWERFLNGKKPVPRDAVEQFASVMGDGAGALLLLEGSEESVAAEARPAGAQADARWERWPSSRRLSPAEWFAAGMAVGALAVAAAGWWAERTGGARGSFGRCPCAADAAGVPPVVSHGVPRAVPGVPNWWDGAYDG